MPYTSHYLDDGRGLLGLGVGLVTSTELHSVAILQGNDTERTRQIKYCICDFSHTTELRLNKEELVRLIKENRRVAQHTPGIPIAIVASTPFIFGMARMWQSFSADLGCRAAVFHTQDEGLAWLREQLESDGFDIRADFPSLLPDQPPLTPRLCGLAA